MSGVNEQVDSSGHNFVFTGKGGRYFFISLVNIILVCITLGIYLPWAIVRTRRYVYSNMMLNGQAFTYRATGGTIFASFLFVMFIYGLIIYFIFQDNVIAAASILVLFVLAIPLMMVKSLQYQARMTSINGVNFGFECSLLRAWLNILILPLIAEIVAGGVVYFIFSGIGPVASISGLVVQVVLLTLVVLVALGAINGFIYQKWATLVGNGGRFGLHAFSIQLSMRQCISRCIWALMTLLPFALLAEYLIVPLLPQLMFINAMGPQASQAFMMAHFGRITAFYITYILGVLVSFSYLYVTLHNLFLNNLSLANNRLHFHSSMTSIDMMLRVMLILVVSGITFGLAYPWLKMYLLGWIAKNTQVIGDLDALELVNDERPLPKDPLMWVSRGIMPGIPFV